MNPALHNLCANYEKTGGRKTCSRSSRATPPAAFAPPSFEISGVQSSHLPVFLQE